MSNLCRDITLNSNKHRHNACMVNVMLSARAVMERYSDETECSSKLMQGRRMGDARLAVKKSGECRKRTQCLLSTKGATKCD